MSDIGFTASFVLGGIVLGMISGYLGTAVNQRVFEATQNPVKAYNAGVTVTFLIPLFVFAIAMIFIWRLV
jgi:fructose-specific phosphotransferase system IIC component